MIVYKNRLPFSVAHMHLMDNCDDMVAIESSIRATGSVSMEESSLSHYRVTGDCSFQYGALSKSKDTLLLYGN